MIHIISLILIFLLGTRQEVGERFKTKAAKIIGSFYHRAQGWYYGVMALYFYLVYPYTGDVMTIIKETGAGIEYVKFGSKFDMFMLKLHGYFEIHNMWAYFAMGMALALIVRSPMMGIISQGSLKGWNYVGTTEKFFNKVLWHPNEQGYANVSTAIWVRIVLCTLVVFTLQYL